MRPLRVAALAAVLVALATSCSEGDHVSSADRRDFCKLMQQPQSTEMSEALSSDAGVRADARRRLDEKLAAVEAVAPRDIRNEVSVYRREIQAYLSALATGPVDAEAERNEVKAGTAVRAYADAHC